MATHGSNQEFKLYKNNWNSKNSKIVRNPKNIPRVQKHSKCHIRRHLKCIQRKTKETSKINENGPRAHRQIINKTHRTYRERLKTQKTAWAGRPSAAKIHAARKAMHGAPVLCLHSGGVGAALPGTPTLASPWHLILASPWRHVGDSMGV